MLFRTDVDKKVEEAVCPLRAVTGLTDVTRMKLGVF